MSLVGWVARASLVASGLWAAAAAPSLAQETGIEAAERLRVGQHVRVEARGLLVEHARVMEVTQEGLIVTEGSQEWVIDPRSLERLEVRRRSPMPTTLAFGLAGLVGGFVVKKMLQETSPEKEYPNTALIGAGIGAGIGFAVGLTRWRWEVVFPR